MRYIKLEESSRQELEKVYRTHARLHVRKRAQCLLLSDRGYRVKDLSRIFSTRTHTVRSWFNRWESEGIQGLEIRSGRGLKPAINEEDTALVASIREEVSADPRNLCQVVERLNERWGTVLTVWQLKSFIKKKLKYSWRRFRECIKQCQDPDLYQYLVSQLCVYMLLEEKGKLKIYYGDESGFSMEPCISCGWQPPGEYTRICPVGGHRLNVFGLLSRDNDLHAWTVEGSSVNSETVIACIDDFVKTVTMKTVLILDNASIHHSKKFNAKLGEWIQKGLRIFHLPAYSPHLNLIETLWRKIKYDWLKPSDYASWEHLKAAIDNILTSVGGKFKIEFDEPVYFKKYKADKTAVIYA